MVIEEQTTGRWWQRGRLLGLSGAEHLGALHDPFPRSDSLLILAFSADSGETVEKRWVIYVQHSPKQERTKMFRLLALRETRNHF